MHVSDYIGIPFENKGRSLQGADCWGLIWLYYRNNGINLPVLSEHYNDYQDSQGISRLVGQEKSGWTNVVTPEKGDVVVFNIMGKPVHVGLCLGAHSFIHAFKGTDSCLESLRGLKWKKRIEGFYRYRQ